MQGENNIEKNQIEFSQADIDNAVQFLKAVEKNPVERELIADVYFGCSYEKAIEKAVIMKNLGLIQD